MPGQFPIHQFPWIFIGHFVLTGAQMTLSTSEKANDWIMLDLSTGEKRVDWLALFVTILIYEPTGAGNTME